MLRPSGGVVEVHITDNKNSTCQTGMMSTWPRENSNKKVKLTTGCTLWRRGNELLDEIEQVFGAGTSVQGVRSYVLEGMYCDGLDRIIRDRPMKQRNVM